MKKVLAILSLSIMLSSAPTYAASDALVSAAVTATVTGTIYTVNSAHYDAWLNSEVNDWKYEETNLTTSLSRSCGVNLELRLHSSRRNSFITFVLSNEQEKFITIKVNDIYASFTNGAVRKLKSNQMVSDFRLDSGWLMQGFFPIQEKEELLDTSVIDVVIPVVGEDGKVACEVTGRLNKNPNRKAEYADYHRLLTLEMSFLLGGNFIYTEELKSSSANQGIFGLVLSTYFYKNMGFTFGFLGQDLKKDNQSEVAKEKGLSGNLKLNERNIILGGAANFLTGRNFSTSINGGLLFHSLENNNGGNVKELQSKTGLYLNGNFNYIYY